MQSQHPAITPTPRLTTTPASTIYPRVNRPPRLPNAATPTDLPPGKSPHPPPPLPPPTTTTLRLPARAPASPPAPRPHPSVRRLIWAGPSHCFPTPGHLLALAGLPEMTRAAAVAWPRHPTPFFPHPRTRRPPPSPGAARAPASLEATPPAAHPTPRPDITMKSLHNAVTASCNHPNPAFAGLHHLSRGKPPNRTRHRPTRATRRPPHPPIPFSSLTPG